MRHAREYMEMAEKAVGDDDKERLIEVADAWLRLARIALDEKTQGGPKAS